MKNIGLILVLLGVICLIVYETTLQSNILLVSSLALEFVGIITYILINRALK